MPRPPVPLLAALTLLTAPWALADASVPASQQIEFKQGKVYEFAALWTKPGKEAQLMRYFEQAFALAQEYGIRSVLGLTPQSSYAGDFEPSLFFINEWPNLEAFNRFINDPREQKLIPQRDDALIKLNVTHARVRQAAVVELKHGDLVEFAAMWIQDDKNEQLQTYYNQAFPIAVRYGARPLAGFVPLNVYRGDLDPQVIGLNQWPSHEAFRAFIADAELQKLLPVRDGALSRLVVNHNRVHFEAEAR